MLNAYLTDVQDLLHDSASAFYSTQRLTRWINSGRQQVAADAECIRVLATAPKLQSAGTSVLSATVTTQGLGYSVLGGSHMAFSAPNVAGGVQATGSIHIVGTSIDLIFITNPGSGYLSPPAITFLGPGSGAIAFSTLNASGILTQPGVEVYPFSLANAAVSATPGVKGVIGVRQIAVNWGNLKPACAYEPWTRFNAFYRAYNFALMNFPTVWSQFGQGESGSVYLWPIPAQALGMDWDCTCVPLDLTNDTDVEAIPSPWTRAVKYWAAHLAFQNAQRFTDADDMKQRYKMELASHRANVQRSVTPNWYYGN